MKSVTIKQLIDDPKNVFMIVTKSSLSEGVVTKETEETYQQVMAIIQGSDRPLPKPELYLGFTSISDELKIKGNPLFVLEAVNYDQQDSYRLRSTTPPLPDYSLDKIVFMSNVMLVVNHRSVYLLRSKLYPSNIRVEI